MKKENTEMKGKLGYLQVILMIGCIPLTVAIMAITIYSAGKMKSELIDSTYLRLKPAPHLLSSISHGISGRIFWKEMK